MMYAGCRHGFRVRYGTMGHRAVNEPLIGRFIAAHRGIDYHSQWRRRCSKAMRPVAQLLPFLRPMAFSIQPLATYSCSFRKVSARLVDFLPKRLRQRALCVRVDAVLQVG